MKDQSQPAPRRFIGIDWADKEHEVFVIDESGRGQAETLEQSPEAIEHWLSRQRCRLLLIKKQSHKECRNCSRRPGSRPVVARTTDASAAVVSDSIPPLAVRRRTGSWK